MDTKSDLKKKVCGKKGTLKKKNFIMLSGVIKIRLD